MRRPLSVLLSASLLLGSVPAGAQTRGTVVSVAVPEIQLGSFQALSAAPSLPVQPLSSSLTSPLSPSALATSLPSPSVVRMDAPLSPSALKAVVPAASKTSVQAAPSASIPSVMAGRSVFDPSALRLAETDGSRAFDGAGLAASKSEDPVGAPESRPPRKNLLQRYAEHRRRPPTAFSRFGKALMLTSIGSTFVPMFVSAAPAMKAPFAFLTASGLSFLLLIPAAVVVWLAGRLLRGPRATRPPPSRRLRAGVLAAGVAVGLVFGAAPHAVSGPIVDEASAVVARYAPSLGYERARWVGGGAMEDEVLKRLALNPVGRQTLDALRDRFGVIRLPTFYVMKQDDAIASHTGVFDGMFISEDEITSRGWTVEQFLRDPELQRRYVRENDDTIAHELTHAGDARRPPWSPGYFRETKEAEEHAYLQEVYYRLAAFEADPSRRRMGQDEWLVVKAGPDGLIEHLREQLSAEPYKDNVRQGNDRAFNDYYAQKLAEWPATRIHYLLIAASRAQTPQSAKMYLDAAKKVAAEAGLPAPTPLPGTPGDS